MYNSISNLGSWISNTFSSTDQILSFFNTNNINNVEEWLIQPFKNNKKSIKVKYLAVYHSYIKNDMQTNEHEIVKYRNLVLYSSIADAIICNRVLEHDKNWQTIFDNFLFSFQKKGICIIDIPFNNGNLDKILSTSPETNISISNKKFLEIIDRYKHISYEIDIQKNNNKYNQTMFFYFKK